MSEVIETPRNKGGRPPTGSTEIGIRMSPELLRWLDEWRASRLDHPTRPEAVRQIMNFFRKSMGEQ